MQQQHYVAEIQVLVPPERVYRAVTQEIDKWWTELSNQATEVGDRLVVQFENTTTWTIRVCEALPHRLLVWKVEEANHDLEGIAKKDEWLGTVIRWQIGNDEAGSKITLTHQGLVPELECYNICEAGWGYFLGSLKQFLESGTGYPYTRLTTG